MTEIEDIDAQILVLLEKKKILKEAERMLANKPFIDRLGKEAFDILDSVKGFGPGKMQSICLLTKDTTVDVLKKKFPLLSKASEHDTAIIIAAINK